MSPCSAPAMSLPVAGTVAELPFAVAASKSWKCLRSIVGSVQIAGSRWQYKIFQEHCCNMKVQDCTANLMRCSIKTFNETSSVMTVEASAPKPVWVLCVVDGLTLEVRNRAWDPPAFV